ncbi:ABC transporter permease [Intrasporangium oryzae NRRL B-24470]|uniref:ABC transporter permease n=1 Tax=Intrasporangium oryzae NRRL B-24470 TaxID=1386089 RepID=W9GDK4_9MICO|nr:ABC transporter ATP-binding protein [Intrasporangium oryzae]EWT02908.1 ABC transporter permease [Intrasporangium oryzae NRRL B-24470]
MTSPATSTLREGLSVIARGIKGQPRWFSLAVLGSVIYGVMTGMTAWTIGWVVEHEISPAIAAGTVTPQQLWTIGGVMAIVVLVTVIGVIGRRLAGGVAMFNLGAMYRQKVTRQYLRLPLSWHHRHPSGQLLSNANADVEATWNVFAPLPMALGVVVMLAFGIVQMMFIDPWLAVVGLTVFPMLFLANVAFQRAMSPKVTLAQQLRADVSEVAHESFEAALIVKSLGREDHEAERFREVTHALRDANIEVGRTRGRFDPAIEAIPTIGTLAVLFVGTLRVSSGYLTAGQVVQVAYLFSILAFPVRALGWVLAELPRAVVGWKRVSAVLEAEGSMTYGDRSLPHGRSSRLQAEQLAYAYEIESESGEIDHNPALVDVTLDVAPGATVAVVGPTGSGKSTLANLMMRLVDPDTGAVLVDGIDLREVRRGGVSEVAALVAQQTFMFDDSVRGNVTLGAPHDDEAVWRALNVAQGAGFVDRLPEALDTHVGERGASLSGGQRQRIALARAIIREPQLLILDDATSAVDPSVEQAILSRLREASSGTTVVVVAYRMATILLADEVVYLEGGRVLDHGTHAELLERCAGYERLVTAYAREAAERAALASEDDDIGADFDDDYTEGETRRDRVEEVSR